MTWAPTHNDQSRDTADSAELLIREAHRASLRRRLRNGLILLAALLVVVGAIVYQVERGGTPAPRIGTDAHQESPPVMTMTLPRNSRVWTLDMMNDSSGYAVAGASSNTRDEQLIKTTNGGSSWTTVASLPYSFVAGQLKPLLHFVTPSIGYSQAFQVGAKWSPDNIYVTTNGGKSWSELKISGQVPSNMNADAYASTSPDYRFSQGVVSLVSLQCPTRNTFPCPTTLSEYRWGASQPFSVHAVANVGVGPGETLFSDYLIAAPSAEVALVAEVNQKTQILDFALTNNAGASWAAVANPCKHFPGAVAMIISGMTLSPSRWILNCSQGTGMNHATVRLIETTNNGRTWTTLNYTPSWSAQRGGIGGEVDQVWTSNGGTVLWSYSSLGYRQVSTNGGRTWQPISVNGRPSNENTGGAPIQFDPVGTSGAYFVNEFGQLLLSKNGTDFTSVRLRHKA
jgi:hypothetical protein